jgi:dihydroorotase
MDQRAIGGSSEVTEMANDSILIRGGRIIDPSTGTDTTADLLVVDGKVAEIASSIAPSGAEVIEADGLIVAPGLIDMHVHLREPGDEEEETIATGSAAAVAGGFTAVACMPNTRPATDEESVVEFVCRQASRAGLCHVYPVGAVTKGRQGTELAEMGQMVRTGAVAFSDDGDCIINTQLMLRALQYASMFDKPILQHCEDADTASGGVMNGGATSVRLGLPGIDPMAEELSLQRDLTLVRKTGARYHVCHISTARAVELVRRAKAEGLPVTAEVCPHHLLLTEQSCETFDTNFKMNPPLRADEDVQACLQGVIDGTIDCLVTDHAPHGIQEKELEFLTAPFGIIGLETALGLFIKALIEPGHLDWSQLIDLMSTRPARVLGLPRGSLAVGAHGDITLIDPNLEWTVDVNQFLSKSRNCPFHDWQLRGRAVKTIVAGETKYSLESGIMTALPSHDT